MSLYSFLECAVIVSGSSGSDLLTLLWLARYCVGGILDILLAVQQQTEQCAQELFDAFSGNSIDYVAFEFLRAKVREAFRECFVKTGAEHDDKLGLWSAIDSSGSQREFSRHIRSETRQMEETRTAMSGLSARTYSWGGEGSLLGRGGEVVLGSRAGFLSTLWKNFKMPLWRSNWMSDSSSEGGGGEREEIDDNSEESSSAILC